MRTASNSRLAAKQSHRPRAATVFAAAFVAGAAAAVGVNRTLDVRMAQAKPRVESEAIFVALRSLPQGSPVTVWDVALRDWPKAMLPTTALRATDDFNGALLKHPLREGQPLLSIQLIPQSKAASVPDATPSGTEPAAPAQSAWAPPRQADADLWAPAAAAAPSPVPDTAPQVSPPPTSPAPVVAVPPPVVTAVEGVPAEPPVTTEAVSVNTVPPHATAPAEPPAVAAVEAPAPTNDAAPAASAETAAVETAQAEPVAGAAPTDGAFPNAPTLAPDPIPTAGLVAQPPAEPVSVIAQAAEPPEPPVPTERPRAAMKYLVVPESIATRADASFATGVPSGQETLAAAPAAQASTPAGPAAPDSWQPSSDPSVKPLPATALPSTTNSTAASRQPTSRSSRTPQARPPQRQGRQPQATPPVNGRLQAPPRFGSAMFPNLSAGVEAIESEMGRARRQRAGEADEPAARRPGPVTAR